MDAQPLGVRRRVSHVVAQQGTGSYDAHPSPKFYQAVRVHHQGLIPDAIIH